MNHFTLKPLPCVNKLFLLEALLRGWLIFILCLGLSAYLWQTPDATWWCKATIAIITLVLLGIHRSTTLFSSLTVKNWTALGICLISLSTLTTFLWAWQFNSVQNSDFGVYYQCGMKVHHTIEQWVNACQSFFMHKNLIYWQRSLLYTLPFEHFMGANYTALKLYNTLLHGATIALWFFGLRHYYGPRLACYATLFFAIYPEWWFTTTLATTDNMAVFFIIAILLLVPQLKKGQYQTRVIIVLSVLLFAANLLRNIGPFLVLTLLFWVLLQDNFRQKLIASTRILFILFLYLFYNSLLSRLMPLAATDPLQLLKSLAAIDFTAKLNSGTDYLWTEYFWQAMPEKWRAWQALNKITLELNNGFYRWPAYLYHKAALLFSGSGYYSFSSFTFTDPNPDTVFTVPKSTITFSPTVLPYLASLVFVYLLLSIRTIFQEKLTGPALISTIWLGVFSFLILGFGESQARYSVLIAPALSLLAAMSLCGQKNDAATAKVSKTIMTSIGFVILVLFFSLGVGLLHVSNLHRPNPLLQATLATDTHSRQTVRLIATYKQLQIIMPIGVQSAIVTLPLSTGTKALSFFISRHTISYLWQPGQRSPFYYRLMLGKQTLLDSCLGNNAVKWYFIPLNLNGLNDRRIQLTVIRNTVQTEDTIDIHLLTERH